MSRETQDDLAGDAPALESEGPHRPPNGAQRRWRFTLRETLFAILLVCMTLAFWQERVRQQRYLKFERFESATHLELAWPPSHPVAYDAGTAVVFHGDLFVAPRRRPTPVSGFAEIVPMDAKPGVLPTATVPCQIEGHDNAMIRKFVAHFQQLPRKAGDYRLRLTFVDGNGFVIDMVERPVELTK